MVLTQHALQILCHQAQALRHRFPLPKSPEIHLASQTKSFSFHQARCKAPAQAQAIVKGEGDELRTFEPFLKAASRSPQRIFLAESASHCLRDLGMEEPVAGASKRRVVDRKGKAEVSRGATGNVKSGVQSVASSGIPTAELFTIMREGFAAMRNELSNKGAVSFDDRIESWIRGLDSAMQEPFSENEESVEIDQLDTMLAEEILVLGQAKDKVAHNKVVKTCDDVVLPVL